jgi:hypothetical protein
VQVFGSGGTFDLFVEDDSNGYVEYGDDIVGLTDGDRLRMAYVAREPLPESFTIWVDFAPHSEEFVCTGPSNGASGHKVVEEQAARGDCEVAVRIADEVDLGELKLRVDYAGTGGAVPGCASGAACVSRVLRNLEIREHQTGAFTVHGEHPQGFAAPIEVLRCQFDPASSPAPLPDDFVVTVVEAGGPPPHRDPLVAMPAVDVAVDCSASPTTTTTTLPLDAAECGQPCGSEATEPSVRDALYILRASVGSAPCKSCICDVDRSGQITSSDALAVLARAVGLQPTVRCVVCAQPLAALCP